MVVFKEIAAVMLLYLYWKSQMKLMLFPDAKYEKFIGRLREGAFPATDLLLRYQLSQFHILSMLKHCNAQCNASRQC